MRTRSLVHAFQPRRVAGLAGVPGLPPGADFDVAGVLVAASLVTEHGAPVSWRPLVTVLMHADVSPSVCGC